MNNKCVICGCVRNCEPYLNQVFDNIFRIKDIFEEVKVIISFDESTDKSLEIINKYRTKLDIDIIINEMKLSNIRTLNIERARNKIIDSIYKKYYNYDYFIMMDFDDVCSKKINIDVLSEGISDSKNWDALFFNNVGYYDYWALSFNIFQFSCWHFNKPIEVIKNMDNTFKNRIKSCDKYLSCNSAFGGFGIYKISKFSNIRYKTIRQIDEITSCEKKSIYEIYNKYGIFNKLAQQIIDCEHRSFHFDAIKQNNARLRISKNNLFPPYEGEHLVK